MKTRAPLRCNRRDAARWERAAVVGADDGGAGESVDQGDLPDARETGHRPRHRELPYQVRGHRGDGVLEESRPADLQEAHHAVVEVKKR